MIEITTRPVYRSTAKGRNYLTKAAAVKAEARALIEKRHEAKRLMRLLLGVRSDSENGGAIGKMVDCIIGAAMLDAVMVISQGMYDKSESLRLAKRTTSVGE